MLRNNVTIRSASDLQRWKSEFGEIAALLAAAIFITRVIPLAAE
jgi:hypothetical protein